MAQWSPQKTHRVGVLVCTSRYVPGLTSEFFLPVHLIEEILRSQEEVVDLASLLVSLCGVIHPQLRLHGQKLADVGHGENNFLHRTILAHNLIRAEYFHL